MLRRGSYRQPQALGIDEQSRLPSDTLGEPFHFDERGGQGRIKQVVQPGIDGKLLAEFLEGGRETGGESAIQLVRLPRMHASASCGQQFVFAEYLNAWAENVKCVVCR